jgi:hypothetical protein
MSALLVFLTGFAAGSWTAYGIFWWAGAHR